MVAVGGPITWTSVLQSPLVKMTSQEKILCKGKMIRFKTKKQSNEVFI